MSSINYKDLITALLTVLLTLTLNLVYDISVWGKTVIVLIASAVVLWLVIFSKNESGDFQFLTDLGGTKSRYLAYSIILIVFSISSYFYVLTYLQSPRVEVLSSTVHPDSGVVIYSKHLNNETHPKLDIKFNGIEFDRSAIPHKRGSHYWSFRPSELKDIPNDLLKHGRSSIRVGYNGTYYGEESSIFVDSSTIKRSRQTKIHLDKGYNMLSYYLDESMPINEALRPIRDILVMAKNEEGSMYMPGENIDQIKSLEPGEGYTVYVSSDTSFFYPRP